MYKVTEDEGMYRILVVDDEKMERECIRFLIEESGLDLEISEAGDGREAMDVLRRMQGADILFTDVQMPLMDGLELIREAEAEFPDMKIIIFSSYADFEYARTALTLGVVNYILKPVVPQELEKSLRELIRQLEEQRDYRKKRDRQQSFLLQYALQRSISGNFENDRIGDTTLEQISAFQTMALLEFKGNFLENHSFFLYESLRADLKLDMESLNLSPTQALLLLRASVTDPQQWGEALLSHIRKAFGAVCYLAVSRPMKAYPSLKDAYAAVEGQLERHFWTPEQYLFWDGEEEKRGEDPDESDDNQQMLQIRRALINRDGAALQEGLDLLFSKYRTRSNQSQIYVKFVFSNLLTTLYPYVQPEEGGENPSLDSMISSLYLQPDIFEIVKLVQNMASRIIRNFSQGPSIRKEILEVTEYIEKNYGKELSVEQLASVVYLTPDYLSRLFKKSMGKSISQYIRQFRMEKAKALLTGTNRKVIEIGREVGYPNYSYFCQSFREYFGNSPDRYRQEKTV